MSQDLNHYANSHTAYTMESAIKQHLTNLGLSEKAVREIFASIEGRMKGIDFGMPFEQNINVYNAVARHTINWCKKNKVEIPELYNRD